MAEPAPATTSDEAYDRRPDRLIRLIAVLVLVLGLVLLIAGGLTWFSVSSHLAAERITVSEDAASQAGQPVNGPLQAWAEAEVIQKHALEATGGKTYAELDREDPLRETAMTASFLRASLFTSLVAYGVAALAAGVGLVLVLIAVALWRAARR